MKNFIEKIRKLNLNREIKEKDIELEDLLKFQREGAIIIDVRSSYEFKEGHIEGAISIPEYKIKKVIKDVVLDKNQKIVLYCSFGGRSKRTQKRLIKLGYTNVYSLHEGINVI